MSTTAAFDTLTGTMAPLPIDNIDTDQIIPARYLKVTDKSGLGEGLFQAWRIRPDGTPDPQFVLNRPEHAGARILVAGDNFGCGSSREHAPWALLAGGFRAVISSGFADIFRTNSFKNGLLLVELPAKQVGRLLTAANENPASEVTLDLREQVVQFPDGDRVAFPIDPFSRHCLLRGVDQLGYLLDQLQGIDTFEASRPRTADVDFGRSD